MRHAGQSTELFEDVVAMLSEIHAASDRASGVIGSTPEELGRFHKAEMDKWGLLISAAGIKVE